MSTTKTKTKRINSNLIYEKLLTNDKTKLTINETDILNKRILEIKQLTTIPKKEKITKCHICKYLNQTI